MEEWKVKQQIYARTHHKHDDIIASGDIVEVAVQPLVVVSYFEQQWEQLIQPAKAFAVALVYADLIEQYFGEDFYDVLDDQGLLLNDRFFQCYNQQKQVYDQIITLMIERNLWEFEQNKLPQVKATVRYFKKEFLSV